MLVGERGADLGARMKMKNIGTGDRLLNFQKSMGENPKNASFRNAAMRLGLLIFATVLLWPGLLSAMGPVWRVELASPRWSE
jgi:hypothetical protein